VIDLAGAQRFVLARVPVLPVAEMAFDEAAGRVLADDVVAAEDVPHFDNSAVDGYAVRSTDVEDVPVELKVVGELAAGAAPDREVVPAAAIRIMTGAPIPPGADAVVMVEDTERLEDDMVRVTRSVAAGAALRHVGSDVRAGDTVLVAGTVVTPAVIGLLASVNARRVNVHPAARVAVLATGDELVADGSPLAVGQIRETNKSMLVALLSGAGCDVVDLGVVADDEAELERTLREAAGGCDAIVTSGGVSMGDYDVVKAVLGEIADMEWMQIAIKPAKPFAFGLLDDVPIFGLPGNPVSSLVSYELLARPALRSMMGHRQIHRPQIVAVADDGLARRPDGKIHLVRVTGEFGDDGRLHVRSVGAQGSHQLAATALADGIAVVPDGDGIAPAGDVPVLFLH
jgi:molybdopterin molybdotransferase